MDVLLFKAVSSVIVPIFAVTYQPDIAPSRTAHLVYNLCVLDNGKNDLRNVFAVVFALNNPKCQKPARHDDITVLIKDTEVGSQPEE